MSVFTMCPDIGIEILNSDDNRQFLSLPWRDYTRTDHRAMFVNSAAQLTVTLAPHCWWLRADTKEPRWCVWRHDHGTPTTPVPWADTRHGETPWELWDTIRVMSKGTPYAYTLSAGTATAGTLTAGTQWDRWAAQYEDGTLTWADLLEITGLPPHDLYAVLDRHNVISR